jgi:hypothetical protein
MDRSATDLLVAFVSWSGWGAVGRSARDLGFA